MTSDDRELMSCWGFFTRFFCTGAAPKADVTIAG
jgi:hypothetical protein